MAYFITQDCISCGDCEPHCPTAAISEGPTKYVIDPAKCNDCDGYGPTPICIRYCPIPDCIVKIMD